MAVDRSPYWHFCHLFCDISHYTVPPPSLSFCGTESNYNWSDSLHHKSWSHSPIQENKSSPSFLWDPLSAGIWVRRGNSDRTVIQHFFSSSFWPLSELVGTTNTQTQMKWNWNGPSDTQCKPVTSRWESASPWTKKTLKLPTCASSFRFPWADSFSTYLCEVLYGNNEGKEKH